MHGDNTGYGSVLHMLTGYGVDDWMMPMHAGNAIHDSSSPQLNLPHACAPIGQQTHIKAGQAMVQCVKACAGGAIMATKMAMHDW